MMSVRVALPLYTTCHPSMRSQWGLLWVMVTCHSPSHLTGTSFTALCMSVSTPWAASSLSTFTVLGVSSFWQENRVAAAISIAAAASVLFK